MMFLIPPATALVLTFIYLVDDVPRAWSKILVFALLVVAIALQFCFGDVVTWILALLLSVGIAISLAVYLAAPL
jgi:hypothetical protein